MTELRPLNSGEQSDLDLNMVMALELIPIDPNQQDEGFLVVGVHMMIEALRAGEALPVGVNADEIPVSLGVLWGEELCRMGSWEWAYACLDSGFEGACVHDPDLSRICFPIHCIQRWIVDKEEENRTMQLFAQLCHPPRTPLAKNALIVMG